MSVFGIRICATDPAFSTGTWLKDSNVQASLATHKVELNISNSTCDSGKMVVAGAILFKHPTYTHRLYYLLAVRRQLPNNTPFFDIGTHQRTQNGIASQHLVVKCGENHQETLTEILSDHLDGKQTTAIYIGTKVLQSMTQEATEDLFDTHQKYVNSIQRLPLSPQVLVNIDRSREEHNPDCEIVHNQSTRAWANSIVTPEGKPLQCDAENGGKDKKAYLLVPSHLIPTIQPILQRYKQHIRAPHTTSNSNARDNTRDRPDEIYVPTASVQRNVNFLKNMSAAAIWRNAPSTIRQGGSPKPPPKITTPDLTAIEDHHETNINSNNNATPIRHGNPKNSGLAHPTEPIINTWFNTPGHTSRQTTQPYIRPMDDNTTATFHSTASTTLNSSQNAQRFSELEASIKANQQNICNMSKQHETMEARIIETMSSCRTSLPGRVHRSPLNKL